MGRWKNFGILIVLLAIIGGVYWFLIKPPASTFDSTYLQLKGLFSKNTVPMLNIDVSDEEILASNKTNIENLKRDISAFRDSSSDTVFAPALSDLFLKELDYYKALIERNEIEEQIPDDPCENLSLQDERAESGAAAVDATAAFYNEITEFYSAHPSEAEKLELDFFKPDIVNLQEEKELLSGTISLIKESCA